MRETIKGVHLANELKMKRSLFSGSYLLVEGDSDSRFYKNFVDKVNCRILNCINKSNAIEAAKILNQENFNGFVTVLDRDYDHLVNTALNVSYVVYTDWRDLEVFFFNSRSFAKLLNHLGSELKLNGLQYRPIDKILEVAAEIGYYRLVNQKNQLGLKFKNLSFREFVDGNLNFDSSAFQQSLKNNSQMQNLNLNQVNSEITQIRSTNPNKLFIVNGHDLAEILSIALCGCWGTNKRTELSAERVELLLMQGFEDNEFSQTNLHSALKTWETTNNSYKILR